MGVSERERERDGPKQLDFNIIRKEEKERERGDEDRKKEWEM